MPKVTLIAGGTGAGKLAVGFQSILEPGDVSVIANTGDDCEFWGLRISPDVDALLFRLAGIFNEDSGFGVAGDSFTTHAMMSRLGEVDWFWLGDRDLAFHIVRTAMLRRGARLTDTALELGQRLGLATKVLPMSDDEVRTFFETDEGRHGFQEYFVREKLKPRLCGIELNGLDAAQPGPEALAALEAADLVIIGPSNPVISIAPITALLGRALERDRTVAISPIVAGRALKGPTVEMMLALYGEATPRRVAQEYGRLADRFVLDTLDEGQAPAIEALGYRVRVTDTVMDDVEGARRLAATILGHWG